MTWGLHAQTASHRMALSGYVIRRSVALAIFGAVFHLTVWPTDILVPFAVMMPMALLAFSFGRRAVVASAVVILATTPILTALFGSYVGSDWTASGSHAADSALGWASMR